nr:membrane protein [bacterium]
MLFTGAYYEGGVSNHFDGERFYNPGYSHKHGLLDLLKWKLTSDKKPWSDIKPSKHDTPPEKVEDSNIRVSYIGHATLLIQTEGMNILTDPMLSNRASPVSWVGPKRVIDPGIKFEHLPKIDVVLVSHNHYDHLDLKTLEKIWNRDKPRIITALGNDSIIKSHNQDIEVGAYDWGDSVTIGNISVHLEPMYHWSKRTLFDANKALWAAFVIKTPNGNIYFAGDTGYGDGTYFKETVSKYGKFRLAILPIDCYEPRWFMKHSHMNPEEAVLVHKILGEPNTVGIHFGVFPLADTGYEEPLRDLETAKQKHKISDRFRTLDVGGYWNIP